MQVLNYVIFNLLYIFSVRGPRYSPWPRPITHDNFYKGETSTATQYLLLETGLLRRHFVGFKVLCLQICLKIRWSCQEAYFLARPGSNGGQKANKRYLYLLFAFLCLHRFPLKSKNLHTHNTHDSRQVYVRILPIFKENCSFQN